MAVGSLGQLTVDLVANTAGFERGMTQAERALKSATREADRQAQSLDKLIGQIDPTVAAYARLDKMEQQLAAHRKAGRLPTEEYNEYIKKLNDTRNALSQTDKAIAKNGMSAKQLANNLRGVPAQFTDIAVSLAAGQNPLTVLLQQGGQLKDMFGGIGPAAKALGGYVIGLVNPFTVAAAAAATLALAYKQGSDEATAYTKAIILSGNAAGTSASRLAEAAAAIDQVSGTQANAAEALALITETGKFTEEQITKIGLAAVAFERETGQAVSKTVDQFKRLAEEPAKASAALNEQYNYLTASVYAQIAALEAQGDAAGAAELAINTYADAMKSRADQINDNLGVIEGAWRKVKSGAAEAWDEMLGVGRPKTIGEELKEVQDTLNKTADPAASFGTIAANAAVLGPLGAIKAAWDEITPSIQASTDAGREQLLQEEARLKGLLDMESERGKAAAEDAKNNKASIKAQEELNKSLLAGRSNAEKLSAEYKLIEKRVAAAALTGVQYTDAQVQALRDAAAKQFADPKGPKAAAAPAYREDAGQRMLDNLRQQSAALQMQSETGDKLGAQAQALVKFQQEIADIKSKQILTADQKSLLASEDLITAQLKRNVALEQEVELRKASEKSLADYEKLVQSLGKQENKALQVTKERFDILEKARQAGLSDAQYSQTSSDIISQSTTAAPKFPGIDATVGGVGGELDKLDQAEKDLESWYETQLEMLDTYRSERADLTAEWDEQEQAVKAEHENKLQMLEQARGRASLEIASSIFGNLTALSQSENKKLVAIGKAAAIAQATISGFQAIQNALAVPPYPLGLALAISAGVATAANIASIAGVGFETGGYTGDGASGDPAGIVHKGEYVFTKQQTAAIGRDKLEAIARNGYQSGGYVLESPRASTLATSAKLDRTLGSIASNADFGSDRSGRPTVNQNIYVTGQVDNRTSSQLAADAAQRQRRVTARLG